MHDITSLVETLSRYNEAYRAGNPIVDDRTYDELVERLRGMAPNHPFLKHVEPETFSGKREVPHPEPMLSTEKAYNTGQLSRFVDRVEKAAAEIGVTGIRYRITPKLDGLAGRDDGRVFVTRGNGFVGYEISSVFAKGVVPVGGRGKGLGEIVIVQSYFDHHLVGEFVHPRNMVVGIVASDTTNPHAEKALKAGVVRFVPYDTLPFWEGEGRAIVADIETITGDLLTGLDYPTDGLVAVVVQEALRRHMGATTHHYRWQIAIKTRGDTAVTTVVGIEWQVGRTGKITPVLQVDPVELSGATIRRVTAHHAGLVEKLGIGEGAAIEIIRSGEVIPKLERVIRPAVSVAIPERCPSCGSPLSWVKDFLKCTNPSCRGQHEQIIGHFFKTLGNADWFGIKTIQRLVSGGFDTLEKIYAMTEQDLLDLGFGTVQTKNLMEALQLSRTRPVEDWRFLSALGTSALGKGRSQVILGIHGIEDLKSITEEDLKQIRGFKDSIPKAVINDFNRILPTMDHLLRLGFNLLATPLKNGGEPERQPLAGQGIVFTGKMAKSRQEMEAGARSLGARVQSSVSGNTQILVCGQDVGEKKMENAKRLGVRILSEADYLNMIGALQV